MIYLNIDSSVVMRIYRQIKVRMNILRLLKVNSYHTYTLVNASVVSSVQKN